MAASRYLFFVPWILLLAFAIFRGLWRGVEEGAGRGFTIGLITLVVGGVVLGLLYALLLFFYYSNGGH